MINPSEETSFENFTILRTLMTQIIQILSKLLTIKLYSKIIYGFLVIFVLIHILHIIVIKSHFMKSCVVRQGSVFRSRLAANYDCISLSALLNYAAGSQDFVLIPHATKKFTMPQS